MPSVMICFFFGIFFLCFKEKSTLQFFILLLISIYLILLVLLYKPPGGAFVHSAISFVRLYTTLRIFTVRELFIQIKYQKKDRNPLSP